MTPEIAAVGILRALAPIRFSLASEKATQADMARFLIDECETNGIGLPAPKREFRLAKGDIPDFFWQHAGILIEVKSPTATGTKTQRQLLRYAQHPVVKVLILVTARAVIMPVTMNGKPLFVHSLGKAWL